MNELLHFSCYIIFFQFSRFNFGVCLCVELLLSKLLTYYKYKTIYSMDRVFMYVCARLQSTNKTDSDKINKVIMYIIYIF